MPELRKDPIVGRWVIIAQSRAGRPNDFLSPPQLKSDRECPFCEHNESETPGEVLAYREAGSVANGPGWRVRVVPNRYPAVELGEELHPASDGIYERMTGVGVHEVIIESPRHLVCAAQMSAENLREVLCSYRQRLAALKQDGRLVYGLIFKNVGAAAGASLEHAHSQLIATPMVPIAVQEELSGSLEYYRSRGNCVFCDMIQQELATPRRVVGEVPGFVAICPYASRFPFETWILPTAHTSHYEKLAESDLAHLARLMRQVLTRIEIAADRPAYNYILHSGPFDTPELSHYHWHIEIIPRLTTPAGFEWGAGFYINPVPPEEAATVLRTVEADCQQS